MTTYRRDPAATGALVAACTIWGTSFVLAKVALAELAVLHVVLYRFLFALAPFLPILLRRRNLPRRRDLWLFGLTGFLMVPVTFVLQFGGLTLSSATNTALLIGTGAPLLALAGVLFEREVLGRRGWTAVALSCLGLVLLVGLPGASADWRGDLMVFVSMVVCTVWVVLAKRLTARYRALQATAWILLFGTASLAPMALLVEGVPPLAVTPPTWAALLALGLGCTTLAYVLWNWGIARVGAGTAGVCLNLEPIVGALLAVHLLGEPLGVGVVTGGVLIVAAATIISSGAPARGPATRPASPAGRPRASRPVPSLRAAFALRQYGRPAGDQPATSSRRSARANCRA